MKTSINGNLILRPYKGKRELESTEIATGFAVTKNKIGIKPLELLVDAIVEMGHNKVERLKAGSKIYFKEETLYTQKWPRAVFESELFPEGFVVGSLRDVVFIEG